MILLKPKFEILQMPPYEKALALIEDAARTCYQSKDKKDASSAEKLISALIKKGHLSVIEHMTITVNFVIDRGVSHELVRHRLTSYSQESTRYVDYKGNISFIIPPWVKNFQSGIYDRNRIAKIANDFITKTANKNFRTNGEWTGFLAETRWLMFLAETEQTYRKLRSLGWQPEKARAILPNCLKTEIVVTTNIREWRHIFKLRCSKAAHPQIREIMQPLLQEMKSDFPVFFADIKEN